MTHVIVGAGPAGIRAAQTLAEHGIKPIVLDENPTWGGQIYRQQPQNFKRTAKDLYGLEAAKAVRIHNTMAQILGKVDYRPSSLVWGAEAGHLDVLRDGKNERIRFDKLIIATGTTDRILPFPGWTLPGIYTLGGAQVALKFQGCGIGRHVVFAGCGPLLYLVAYQYARAGAKVEAVLDTSGPFTKMAGLARMVLQPAVLAKGIYYAGWLRANGVPVYEGTRVIRAIGGACVEKIVWRDGSRERETVCDAIGFGYALRSETQLADLLGCTFSFHALERAYLPDCDSAGRSSVPGIYLAGDGVCIQGADAAEWTGELAALALLSDSDSHLNIDRRRMKKLGRKLAGATLFRRGLERAFPFPKDWASTAPDDLIICRCEEITAGQLRKAVTACGALELNRLKALTRVGMGRCQGRMCGASASEILAQATAQPIGKVGRLRSQAPIKPIPFSMACVDKG